MTDKNLRLYAVVAENIEMHNRKHKDYLLLHTINSLTGLLFLGFQTQGVKN